MPELLETKLNPPIRRPQAVVRDRLLERLQPAAGVKLVLVAAPAPTVQVSYGSLVTLLGRRRFRYGESACWPVTSMAQRTRAANAIVVTAQVGTNSMIARRLRPRGAKRHDPVRKPTLPQALAVFLIVGIVLLLFLPWPWNLVGAAVSFVLFLGELLFWHRRVRARPKAVGAQNLVGRTATVISACRPDGQVRLSGEIWAARCPGGADEGDTVTIVGRDELTLLVEPAASTADRSG